MPRQFSKKQHRFKTDRRGRGFPKRACRFLGVPSDYKRIINALVGANCVRPRKNDVTSFCDTSSEALPLVYLSPSSRRRRQGTPRCSAALSVGGDVLDAPNKNNVTSFCDTSSVAFGATFSRWRRQGTPRCSAALSVGGDVLGAPNKNNVTSFFTLSVGFAASSPTGGANTTFRSLWQGSLLLPS